MTVSAEAADNVLTSVVLVQVLELLADLVERRCVGIHRDWFGMASYFLLTFSHFGRLLGLSVGCCLGAASGESVLLAVGRAELEVDSEIEDDQGDEGDDSGDDQLVPPRTEGDVVLVFVQRRRRVNGLIVGRQQTEFEKLGNVEGTLKAKDYFILFRKTLR